MSDYLKELFIDQVKNLGGGTPSGVERKYLTDELTSLGFTLGDEDEDMYMEDYLGEDGVYRETIPLNKTGFNQLCDKVAHGVIPIWSGTDTMRATNYEYVNLHFVNFLDNNGRVTFVFDVFEITINSNNTDMLDLYVERTQVSVGGN